MPRPAKFSEERILKAASRIVAAGGPKAATIGAIAAAIGAPSGSIYHRFPTRDELLGRLWLTKAAFFQDSFAAALDHPDPRQAALQAALSLPQSVRADFSGARIMLLHRREDFLGGGWPPEMREEANRLGKQVVDVIADCSQRLFGSTSKAARSATAFAIIDVPYASVRRYVGANEVPPPEVDRLISVAVTAILDHARAGG